MGCRDTGPARAVAAARSSSSRSMAGPRVVVGGLVETVNGLLYRAEVDDPAHPFRLSDWDDPEDGAWLSLGQDGHLKFQPPDNWDGPGWAHAHNAAVGEHEGPAMTVAYQNAIDKEIAEDVALGPECVLMLATTYKGNLQHPAITTPERVYGRTFYEENVHSLEDYVGIGEKDSGGSSLSRTFLGVNGRNDEKAWVMVWADGAGNGAIWDEFHDHFESISGLLRSSGFLGFGINVRADSSPNAHIINTDRRFDLRGRYVTVHTAPGGSELDVIRGDTGEVLATGSEAGGEIQVDMMSPPFRALNPKLVTQVKLRQSDGAETTLEPEKGVWGGSEFDVLTCN